MPRNPTRSPHAEPGGAGRARTVPLSPRGDGGAAGAQAMPEKTPFSRFCPTKETKHRFCLFAEHRDFENELKITFVVPRPFRRF